MGRKSKKRPEGLKKLELKVLIGEVFKHKELYDWSHERHLDREYILNVWVEIGKETGFGARACRLSWHSLATRFLYNYNRRTLITGWKDDFHEEMMPFLPFIYKDLKAMKMEEDLMAEKKLQESGNSPSKEPYITLINCVYQHRELYDDRHPLYYDDNYTVNIWRRIGEHINCTVGSCQNKWRNTHTAFFRFYTNVTLVTGKKHVLHDLLVRFVPFLPKFREFHGRRNQTWPNRINTNQCSPPLAVMQNVPKDINNAGNNSTVITIDDDEDTVALCETNTKGSYTDKDNINDVKNTMISIEPSTSTSCSSNFATDDFKTKLEESLNDKDLIKTERSNESDVINIKNENVVNNSIVTIVIDECNEDTKMLKSDKDLKFEHN